MGKANCMPYSFPLSPRPLLPGQRGSSQGFDSDTCSLTAGNLSGSVPPHLYYMKEGKLLNRTNLLKTLEYYYNLQKKKSRILSLARIHEIKTT